MLQFSTLKLILHVASPSPHSALLYCLQCTVGDESFFKRDPMTFFPFVGICLQRSISAAIYSSHYGQNNEYEYLWTLSSIESRKHYMKEF